MVDSTTETTSVSSTAVGSNPQKRWANMRRMAWVSLIASLAFPVLVLAANAQVLGAIAGPFYLFTGAVVGAYMGFSTWGDKPSAR